jgi:hypothetical protein
VSRLLRNYLAISLVISSDVAQPETITERVGLRPTETRIRGTPTKTGILRKPEFDVHEWWIRDELEIGPEDRVEDLQPLFVSGFLNRLSSAAEKIRELASDHRVLIILVYQMDRVPYIGLSHSQVEKIGALGASIDFDIMAG